MTTITVLMRHTADTMNVASILRTYRWMAPLYDPLFERFYRSLRGESIASLRIQPTDVVVLVGAGTGLDIGHLPKASRVIAIDMTSAMLRRAATTYGSRADYVLGDGTSLPLRDARVSVVILHLVLSVAADPEGLLLEAARVLQVGGRVAILDHFAPAGRVSLWRRMLARFPAILGTHMDRQFEDLTLPPSFNVLEDRRLARGMYRSVILERIQSQ